MAVEDIFSRLSAHMAKGLMIHDQIATAFGFLNLCGYQKEHEYHFYEESKNYRCLQDYYLSHYHKLIPEEEIENPQIIPANWRRYSKMDVDINTRRNAIKDLMKKWINWEEEAKKLFEDSYIELYNAGEVATAMKIKEFLLDTTQELAHAQCKLISLEAMDYDMAQIVSEQNKEDDD